MSQMTNSNVESNGSSRPAIPAELRRRVLVEAGHRCAIPTCRHIDVDVHHIIPWAECRVHEYENLIALCPNCHRRAGKGEIDRKSIRLYKLNLRFSHDKFSQLEMDVLFEMASLPDGQTIHWPPFNKILLKRLQEAGLILIREAAASVLLGGMRANPDFITITPKGREFIADLGSVEL